MKVCLVHYHFQRGGVTRVAENATAALAAHGAEVLALSGEDYPANTLPHARVEGLAYTADPGDSPAPAKLAERMLSAATEGFGGAPDLWHIHNPSLGKHVALPALLRELRQRGQRLLLQIHDFAEDGRPDNYATVQDGLEAFGGDLYPTGPGIHYALLNDRDHRIFLGAGAERARCHLLPNAVSVPDISGSEAAGLPLAGHSGRLFLYPTRAIRRKNLGEFLLLAALGHPGDRFATTLRPENDRWQPVHDRWVSLSKQLGLAVDFGVGANERYGFTQWMARADGIVTTSVAEGFGLAFLEPWLFGKPLHGRNLPEITADFTRNNIELAGLYDELCVPASWVDSAGLRHRLARALARAYEAYGREVTNEIERAAFAAITSDQSCAFGRLDEPAQRAVLERVSRDPQAARQLDAYRAGAELPPDRLKANADAVRKHYSLEAYGSRLHHLYEQLLAEQPAAGEPLEPRALLEAFLDPARFNLLRTGYGPA